jgi:ornithine carbamoyltransferase
VPVINGLSDAGHPVQILADLFTVEEKLGGVEGKIFAFIGDCASNMALSFCEAAPLYGFQLHLAAPEGYLPPAHLLRGAKTTDDPAEAVRGADVVITDVWISMGQEKEAAARKAALGRFIVDERLMKHARPNAIVLHCLPAHRGRDRRRGPRRAAERRARRGGKPPARAEGAPRAPHPPAMNSRIVTAAGAEGYLATRARIGPSTARKSTYAAASGPSR